MRTHLPRRAVLRGAVLASAALAGVGPLAGCANPTPIPVAAAGPPQRGGRLRVAALGAPTDSLSPLTVLGFADYAAFYGLYDSLAVLVGDRVQLSLAESAEPNADATSWTVRLRPDVRFHDGRPVGAADVAYSLRTFGDPTRSPNYAQYLADVDLANIRTLDERTVELPMRRPRGDLVDSTLGLISFVFPAGTTDADWVRGIGSGPFRLAAYEAGASTRMVRNDEYWDGAPLLDEVEIVAITDGTARLNAVKSGEIDYAVGVPSSAAATEAANPAVSVRRGGPANSNALMFTMNLTQPPFDDPQVRRAMRLLVDRQALVDTVLFGQGIVGNDVAGLGLPGYDASLPARTRDVEQARSLLAAAGVTDVTLRAADLTPGLVDAARLFAEQAREAGLTVQVEQAAADTYFSDFATLLSTPVQAFYFINRPIAAHIGSFTGSASQFNLTGAAGDDYDAALADAQGTVDAAARAEKFVALQRGLYDDGGEIVWGFAEQLDVTLPQVRGVELVQSVPLLGKASVG